MIKRAVCIQEDKACCRNLHLHLRAGSNLSTPRVRQASPFNVRSEMRSTEAKFPIVGSGPSLRRSEEHTSELQSLMRISYAVFCLKKKKKTSQTHQQNTQSLV